MRASVGKRSTSETVVHQVYFSVLSGQWLFLDRAHSQGRRYPTTKISREVTTCNRFGCRHVEDITVNLKIDEIQLFASTGFTVQLSGSRGNRVIRIPPTFFGGYLDGLKQQGFPIELEGGGPLALRAE